MQYQIEYALACHRGRVRPDNQDNFCFQGRYLPAEHEGIPSLLKGRLAPAGPVLFAVFDGMGGEDRGETASFLAARTLDERAADGRMPLEEACREANRRIVRFTEERRLKACGTTAAMLRFTACGIEQCHIGDSRIYRYRDGRPDRLTGDDVFPMPGYRKPPLLQFLGVPEEEMRIEPHVRTHEAVIGDVYLICTDGLSDMVPLPAMTDIIRSAPVAGAGEALLDTALEAGGRDNITFFLLQIVPA